MALNKRLTLGLLTISSLLFVFFLCVNLERTLRRYQDYIQVKSSNLSSSEGPLASKSNRTADQLKDPPPASTVTTQPSNTHRNTSTKHTPTMKAQTPTNTEHKPADLNNVLDVSNSSSKSVNGSDKSRIWISTKATTVKPKPPTTDPPYIADIYMSEEAPPQTISVNDTEFRARFLKNIPVLLLARHVTPEQYQRLSLHQPCHGWKDVKFSTLNETFSVLNSSANLLMYDDWNDRRNQSKCIRCAVVGNGGILRKSKKGKEIDSHHYVFRTNGAIINGFEKDVGTRTTHYTFTTHTLMNAYKYYEGVGYKGPPRSKETRYVFLPSDKRDYMMVTAAVTHTQVKSGYDKGKDPSKFFGKDVSAEKFKIIHPDFMRYIRNRFLRSNYRRPGYHRSYRPSTGAAMLLAALHTCDQVSAYGFMTPDYNKHFRYYYDRKHAPVTMSITHDMKLEMKLWQQLHQAGLIQLYMHK